MKAVIFVNIYSLVLFSYLACTKHATTSEGINTLDLCLVRAFVLLIGAFMMTLITKQSVYVERHDRCNVLAFTLTGTLGIFFLLYGVAMVPLLVQSTLLNTAPFWASLLGCIVLSERLANVEIMALLFSFVGVILVAFPSKVDETATEEAEEESSSTGSYLIGCFFIIVAAWVEAVLTLIARRMQKLSFSVMLFWYGCTAVPINIIIILGESLLSQASIRFWDYDASQFGWMILITSMNFIALAT